MDIILLVVLAVYIKKPALRKGQDPLRWRMRLVIMWIGLELLGFFIGYSISHNIITASLLGFALAVGSYLIVKYQLDRLPDVTDNNWEDRLGRQD